MSSIFSLPTSSLLPLTSTTKPIHPHCYYLPSSTPFLSTPLGKEPALGLMHRSTLDSVFNLGTLLTRQGPNEYPLALLMYERAWKGYEVTLGCWHDETLNAIHHLGSSSSQILLSVCMY